MNKIKQGQSFLDKVTQLTGSYENAVDMAVLNGVSITDEIEIAKEIKSTGVTNSVVASFFSPINEPATDISDHEIELLEDIGIGQMEIESTFVIR